MQAWDEELVERLARRMARADHVDPDDLIIYKTLRTTRFGPVVRAEDYRPAWENYVVFARAACVEFGQ